MKKAFKVIGILVGSLVLLAVLGAVYINIKGIPKYEHKAPELTVHVDSLGLAEGARLASLMCANCHRSEDGKLGGSYQRDAADFGEIYAPNITQHPEYGITDYSAGELAYLLRTGIKKDGTYSPPYMIKLPHLSDEDMNNLIAFLRSDHPMVQPSDHQTPPSKPNFLTKLLCQIAFKPLPYPSEPIPTPNPADIVTWGRYLATAKYDCYACHSADFKTADLLVPENSEGYFGGGNPLKDLEGQPNVSANLTMDKETGLGKWTEEQFIRAVKTGIRPDGIALRYPMVPYGAMTDEEISAIWAYLQTVPVIHNPIAR